MAKLPIQKIQWNVWATCEDDFDLEIEVPNWLEDVIRSAETNYGASISALDSLVKSQQVPARVKIAYPEETVTIDPENLSSEAREILWREIQRCREESDGPLPSRLCTTANIDYVNKDGDFESFKRQVISTSEREQLAKMGLNSERSRAAIEEALDKIREESEGNSGG